MPPAVRLVNAPVLGVVAPTVPLSAPLKPVLAVMVVPVIAAAVMPPIAGGLARYVENPVPLTVELADNVVNAPVLGVVAPTVPLMFIEAVPDALVNVMALGVPKFGVVNVGLVDKTTAPVPVSVEKLLNPVSHLVV